MNFIEDLAADPPMLGHAYLPWIGVLGPSEDVRADRWWPTDQQDRPLGQTTTSPALRSVCLAKVERPETDEPKDAT